MKIYKYPLAIKPEVQEVFLPWDAKILTVQVQKDMLCLWALIPNVDHSAPARKFLVAPTGSNVIPDDEADYLGTVQICEGDIVLHVFEVR